MVTPLDFTGLEQFGGIFPFLFVLVLVYAVLSRIDLFKNKPGLAGLIAFFCAVMTLFSTVAMKTINLMAPWFVLFVIFLVLFLIAFMMFGYNMSDVTKYISSGEFGVGVWVMAIMLIIGIGSLAAVVNEEYGFRDLAAGEQADGQPSSNEVGFWQTLFHPKILGMVLILLIAFFTIKKMTSVD